jgi:sulfite exporter TauE/SafE
MVITLVTAAVLLGIGGTPHCAAMCAAPCAAITRCRADAARFHAGRIVGYMAGGAAAAASVSSIGAWREAWPLLQPLWVVVHVALLVLGLWLVVTGRQPEMRFDRAPVLATARGWVAMQAPRRAGTAGLAWIAWPCGLLQTALLLSALANDALGGAVVMAAFAIGSMPALWLAPVVLRRLGGSARATGIRIAGALLSLASIWALGHGMWQRALDWCLG